MSNKSTPMVATMGIDIGKNSFHVIGLDRRGAVVLRQKWSRSQIEARVANMPPCLIGMEACVGAHYLSRKLQAQGHDARLMPAKYVRAYLKGQKNDFRDAEAIAEAVQRPTMKFVATKTAEQLDLQALHRARERLVRQRTGIINQIRAFLLERGVAVRQGQRFLRTELPTILAKRSDALSPRMMCIIENLAGDWRRLDERIEGLSSDITRLVEQDPACERLMTVPGIGPIISLERHCGRDRQRRGVRQGARLRRLARTGAPADIDGRPHNPWQDIEAGKSISTRAVRAGCLGGADPTEELGAPRAQAVD
jgi:transposase